MASSPLTVREFVSAAATAMGGPDGFAVLPKWMLPIGGMFNRILKETAEIACQYESPYLFDSSKFNQAFGFTPVSYAEGIAQTAKSHGG
jgi:nucleoside-diphosphate-sugar epimerase